MPNAGSYDFLPDTSSLLVDQRMIYVPAPFHAFEHGALLYSLHLHTLAYCFE